MARGVKLLIKAADQGQHEAQQEAGMMYAYGSNGVKRDQEKAVKYLEAACEGGVQQAMTNYANMCFEGQAVPRDMAKAANVRFAAAGWSNDIPEIEAFMRQNCDLYFKTVEAFGDYLLHGKEA